MEKDLDKKLYDEYLSGNKDAFETLYSKYKNKIQYFIFNIVKDYQIAEDITQEVFIYIMNNKLKENCSFKYYIYLVAKSRALSYISVENRRDEIAEKSLLKEENEKDVLEIITEQENKKELVDAINQLEDKYKNALYLVKIEEFSYIETAEILGQNVQNIKNLVHRGKNELRKILIKKGFNDTNKVLTIFLVVLCSGIILSGVVFAKDIRDFVNNIIENIFGTYNQGITTAIENGYKEKVNSDYIKSNDIEMKIDDIILDDYNLGIVSSIKVDKKTLKDLDVSKIELLDLLIMDENNNVLFAEYDDIQEFLDFCEDNNLDKGVYFHGASNGGYRTRVLDKEDNKFTFTFSTTSDCFPNSKKLFIKLKKIYLLKENLYIMDKIYRSYDSKEADKSEYRIIEGNWKFEVDLENLQKQRKTIEYVVTNINDDKTTVTKANLSMTNMKLELVTSSDKIDFDKLKNRDRETMNVIDMIPFNMLYIETSNGERFSEIGSEGNGYSTIEDGKIRFFTTIDYTYYDKSDNIKIVLPTNKREEIIIELESILEE